MPSRLRARQVDGFVPRCEFDFAFRTPNLEPRTLYPTSSGDKLDKHPSPFVSSSTPDATRQTRRKIRCCRGRKVQLTLILTTHERNTNQTFLPLAGSGQCGIAKATADYCLTCRHRPAKAVRSPIRRVKPVRHSVDSGRPQQSLGALRHSQPRTDSPDETPFEARFLDAEALL